MISLILIIGMAASGWIGYRLGIYDCLQTMSTIHAKTIMKILNELKFDTNIKVRQEFVSRIANQVIEERLYDNAKKGPGQL
jgi:hypothetical protein